MAEKYKGCAISIEVGGGLGYYQGTVKQIDTQTQMVTLSKVIHNGKPCDIDVTINSADIIQLKILHSNVVEDDFPPRDIKTAENAVTCIKSTPKSSEIDSGYLSPPRRDLKATGGKMNIKDERLQNTVGFKPIKSQSSFSNSIEDNGVHQNQTKVIKEKKRTSVGEQLARDLHLKEKQDIRVPHYEQGNHRRDQPSHCSRRLWGKSWNNSRDETTFGTPIDDDILKTEFDFEKNLALFNKQAVKDEIENSRPDVVRQADFKAEPKFRCDENIISAATPKKRKIIVPAEHVGELIYVTDNGLLVPSVTVEMRLNLLSTANQSGLTKSRQLEMIGRAATDVILSLIGGSHRLEPGNSHQAPVVAILCGVHAQGAAGVNCGRQLESHGVKTVVITPPIPSSPTPSLLLSQETQLYTMTEGTLASNVKSLSSTAVDLIVDARFDLNGNNGISCLSWVEETTSWATASRAPLVALDPPNVIPLPITPKIILCPTLPLAHSPGKGKIYLMNLNIPHQIFLSLGIKYTSPFGAKIAIPLHACE